MAIVSLTITEKLTQPPVLDTSSNRRLCSLQGLKIPPAPVFSSKRWGINDLAPFTILLRCVLTMASNGENPVLEIRKNSLIKEHVSFPGTAWCGAVNHWRNQQHLRS